MAPRRWLTALAVTPALLVSCAGPDSPAARIDSADAGFPLTVASCGVSTTLQGPPQRIVTIKSSATEMVLALGAGDRLVGTAFSDGPLPAGMPAPAAPELAPQNPSWEVVASLEPDLVYAGWESNLSADGAGDRDRFEALGISTYVSPAACHHARPEPKPLSFEDVFDQIVDMGEVLGEPQAAQELVAQQRQELTEVTSQPPSGRRALWYSSGSDVPYVGAGAGTPQMMMAALGLENIAADIDQSWASLSWEVVAQRDPEVIVLVDSSWNTAQHKMAVLGSNPITAHLPAVIHQRYLIVDFPATEAGVRNVPATVDLAEQLREQR